jgi:hypothetical protein
MRNTIASLVAALGITLAASASEAAAQASRWSFEGRLNVTMPVGDLSDAGAESGLGLGADVFYTFMRNMSAYAGLSRHAFNCEGAGCDDVTSSGLQGGVKLLFGAERRAMPWARGGIMLHKADFDGDESDLTLGAELGGGIDLMLSPRFALAPSLRFHTYPAGFAVRELDMSYFTISLGAHFHF